MGWFSTIVGGGIGAIIAGPFGAIIGATIGSSFGNAKQGAIGSGRGQKFESEQRQALFFTAAFSMVGKLAKADGRICEEEIAVIQRVSKDVMGLDPQTRQFAHNIITASINSRESFADYAREFGRLFSQEQDMSTFMMSFLFEVAMANGELHTTEEKLLLEAKQFFRINDAVYQSLYSRFVKRVAPTIGKSKHYETIGVTPDATQAEIKKAYRDKVAEYHPDKIQSKGLPPEFMKFANDKMAEINAAYDAIKK
jgi:DnaJ like chaperone protein